MEETKKERDSKEYAIEVPMQEETSETVTNMFDYMYRQQEEKFFYYLDSFDPNKP